MSDKYGPFAHPLIPWDEVKTAPDEFFALGEMARARLRDKRTYGAYGVYNEFMCSREACTGVKWKSLEPTSKCFVCGRFATRTFFYKATKHGIAKPR